MQIFTAKKKAEDMREELRSIISFTRGPSSWDELIRIEADIRKKRQKAIYDQEERRRKVLEWTVGVSLMVIGILIFAGIVYLIKVNSAS